MAFALFMRRAAGAAICLGLAAGNASALGLIEAYQAALRNDPVFQAAIHENQAGKQFAELGRANILPSVSLSYSTSKNKAEITSSSPLGDQTTRPDYTSAAGSLSLRQPIINLEGMARYRLGKVQTRYSDAQFAAQKQDLVIRLVSAYAEAQYAQDQLALAIAQRDAFAEQMRVNARTFDKGEGTRTDMLETRAKFDFAEAQVIEARDAVVTALNLLTAIVGIEVTQQDALSENFRMEVLQPGAFDEWKQLALENNPEIAIQRLAVNASALEIDRSRAGHAPRLDLVASYAKNKSDSFNTFNQDADVRSVGVQLTIPLYAGGSVNAAVTQAVANRNRAKADLEATMRQVMVELRKQYSLLQSSVQKIDALNKSVESARMLVTATEQSIKGGVRINLDLLNAQQQLYLAKRDLVQAKYNYLLSDLRLRKAAGTLNQDSLVAVSTFFDAKP